MFIRICSWVARLAGLGALLLGLLLWFAGINYISLHILFGFLVTLALLILSSALAFLKGGRILGVVGIIYALVVPVVGELQSGWYVISALWLIPTIHLLIGVGAIGLAQVITGRYAHLKKTETEEITTAQTSQMAR